MERSDVADRIRLAILELQRSGAPVTVRAVRVLAKCETRRVGPVLRAWQAGEMPPLDQAWSEPEPELSLEVEELAEEIEAADTVAKLEAVTRRVTTAILRMDIPAKVGDFVLGGLREQRLVLKLRMMELQDKSVRAIEILTPDELQALEEHRRARRPPPVSPGEAVEPP